MDLTHKTMKRRAAERAAKVQDYKRANPEATLDEMARVFKVSRETVRGDLLKGQKWMSWHYLQGQEEASWGGATPWMAHRLCC